MRKLLLTGWAGAEYRLVARETVPLLYEYSQRHGYEFACECMRGSRPPAWAKIALLNDGLRSFERVVWIDADVVVERADVDVMEGIPEMMWQSLVLHTTECGEVPNTGVWVLSNEMVPFLEEAWKLEMYIDHAWWEQAAILKLMGYIVTENIPVSRLGNATPLYQNTHFLDPTWNHHRNDLGRVDKPRFRHVTQYPNRLAAVKRYARIARGRI